MTVPPPPDTEDEIPDTEPAPVALEVPRVPSLPWVEEQVTAVECPHPPGLSDPPAPPVSRPCAMEQPGPSGEPVSTPAEVVWAIEHPSRQRWLGPGCNGKGLQLWCWGPSIFRHDTREAAQARLDELRAQGVTLEGYEVTEHLEVPPA